MYINTRDEIGEIATLDGLVERTLTEFTDTDVVQLSGAAFYYDKTIEKVILPGITSLGSSDFFGCYMLKELHIGTNNNSVCTLSATSSFSQDYRCIFFVPANLLNSYKNASNWSTFADRIYAEGDTSAPVWTEEEIQDTDAEIVARINNGTASSYYKPGQYKTIDFGTLGSIRMQIIGVNKDELSSGNGYAQLTWFPYYELPNIQHRMNPACEGSSGAYTIGTGGVGGWDASELKTYLNDTVWYSIPEIWRSVIKEVKKYSRSVDTTGTVQNNVLSNEKIWIPSAREISSSSNKETTGIQYLEAFNNGTTKIRYNLSGNAVGWWTRTAIDRLSFSNNSAGGGASSSTASNTFYVAFGFCT